MRSINIDVLNISLIIVSAIIAYLLPFELFLWAYAILGPLHYLTEINWIHGKKYFVDFNLWAIIPVISCLLIVTPKVLISYSIIEPPDQSLFGQFIYMMNAYSTSLIVGCLVLSVGLIYFKAKKHIFVLTFVVIALAIIFNNSPAYSITFGLFLPTLIHVYVFTLLFMLYGALNSQSRFGYLSVVTMVLVPICISLVTIDPSCYSISQYTKDTFLQNRFHHTNVRLSQLLGLSDGTSFFFYEKVELKLQVFIAFAYLYHYLNWFTKTSVIGWHKQLTSRKSLVIFIVWTLIVSLFWYDYQLGFYAALFLSFLHVLLEFPINIMSIKGILTALRK